MVDAPISLRRGKHGISLALAGAALAAMLPASASAASAEVLMRAAPGLAPAEDCAASTGAASVPADLAPAAQSKSAAILGGSSALDAIRAQQEGVKEDHPLLAGVPAKPLEPAAAPSPARNAGCSVASPFAARPAFDPVKPLSFVPRPQAQQRQVMGDQLFQRQAQLGGMAALQQRVRTVEQVAGDRVAMHDVQLTVEENDANVQAMRHAVVETALPLPMTVAIQPVQHLSQMRTQEVENPLLGAGKAWITLRPGGAQTHPDGRATIDIHSQHLCTVEGGKITLVEQGLAQLFP